MATSYGISSINKHPCCGRLSGSAIGEDWEKDADLGPDLAGLSPTNNAHLTFDQSLGDDPYERSPVVHCVTNAHGQRRMSAGPSIPDIRVIDKITYVLCLVSRVTPVQTASRNCTGDGGGPFGFGDQVADPKPPQAAAVKSRGGCPYGGHRLVELRGRAVSEQPSCLAVSEQVLKS